MRARVGRGDAVAFTRRLETARREGREGREEESGNQPDAAEAIMVITREHVHYDAVVSTREARLGAARFRLEPLLPLAYFASRSVRQNDKSTIHR